MSSRFLSSFLLLASLATADPRILRVCADPNNLPFSNQRGEGFENRLAELIASDLGAKLEYTWWSQRRSFIRNSLGQDRCDALMGVPAALDSVAVTHPYYRSSYVFVSRQARHLSIESLDDPRFASWRIGIHMVGEDYAPPAVALARRGVAGNVKGYKLYGAYGDEDAPARLIHAVASGEVDIAIAWGPIAGYFAARESSPLEIVPVSPATFQNVPFTFEISMGVRKGNDALRSELQGALGRHCAEVQAILKRYGVPQLLKGENDNVCGPSHLSPVLPVLWLH